jgi:polyketide synthase PksN
MEFRMRQADIISAYKAGKLSTTELQEMLGGLAQRAVATPLSEGQRGLWMLQKLSLDMSAYNVPICLKIGRELDAEKLREACAFLLEQFPILTSVIEEEDGALSLVPRPSSSPWFQREVLPPALDPTRVLDHMRQSAKTPFALASSFQDFRPLC